MRLLISFFKFYIDFSVQKHRKELCHFRRTTLMWNDLEFDLSAIRFEYSFIVKNIFG